MALKVLFRELHGTLLSDVSASTSLLPFDLTTIGILQTNVDFLNGGWTYVRLSDGADAEEVKVVGISGAAALVKRGQSGSTPTAFLSADTTVTNVFGLAAIQDTIAANPSPSSVTVAGAGVVDVSETGDDYTVNVPVPQFLGIEGAVVTGGWPKYTISYEQVAGSCGCSGGGSGGQNGGVDAVSVTSSSLQANITGTTLNLALQTPTFTAGPNMTITGAYPAFTFTSQQDSAQIITVTAGTGIAISGDPASNPTVSISNTGVAAGTYAGIAINARGQITSIPLAFNALDSIIFTDTDTASASVSGQTAQITLSHATRSSYGLTQLADASAAFNGTDDTTVATPAVVQAGLDALPFKISGATVIPSGISTSAYSNLVAQSATTVKLASGESCMVVGTMAGDKKTGATGSNAVALMLKSSSGTALALQPATQQGQTIMAIVSGPFNDTIQLYSTVLDTDWFDVNAIAHSLGVVQVK